MHFPIPRSDGGGGGGAIGLLRIRFLIFYFLIIKLKRKPIKINFNNLKKILPQTLLILNDTNCQKFQFIICTYCF